VTRAHGEGDRRDGRHEQQCPLPEHDRENSRLSSEEREPEHPVHHGAARHELAQQRAQRDGRTDHRERHPDPRCGIQRQKTERQERDHSPGHVVEDRRVVALRVEGDARRRVVRGVPWAHPGKDGSRPGPETGEVVYVKDLETAVERPEEQDEEDADQDRDEVREIGTSLRGHVVTETRG